MKTNFILLLFLTFLTSLSYGQSVEGLVLDEKDDGIFYATVGLFNVADSIMVDAVSTDDDGRFMIEAGKGTYYLKATMLGYEDVIIDDVVIDNNILRLPPISLSQSTNLLKTVEITSKVPLMEQRADKIIVNVENNISNIGGNLLDVMKKVPGMLVVNDKISLIGSGTPTILINGRSTQYMDISSLLRDIPGDNIKSVEIIHQPGAEYEASGSGPILNIILKKNSLFGTNGSISVGVSKGDLYSYNTGLTLSHYSGAVNISGGLGYAVNSFREELDINRRLTNINPLVDGVYDQTNISSGSPFTYRGDIKVDWDITKKHRIGLESKYYNNTNKSNAVNTTDIDLFSPAAQDYSLFTDNEKDRGWSYNSINPYYIFAIDTSGQKLEVDLSYGRYKVEGFNTLTTLNNINNDQEVQRYTQPGDTKIYAATVDYTVPLSEIFELKVGGKFSEANLDNNLISEYIEDDMWVNNTAQSNHYLFDETIKAGYGKILWVKDDWSGTAGLRYEHSRSEGNSLTLDSLLSRTISKVFPSFSLTKKFGVLSSTVTYSKRIARPRYSTLNPFVFYLDPFTSERGNPSLRPELAHSGKFSLAYEGQPFFNVEYKVADDAIVEVTEQDPFSEEAIKTEVNFDNNKYFSTSLFAPLSVINGLDGYVGIILSNQDYASQYIDGNFERSKWNTTLVLQAQFKLPYDINSEIGGWYTSGSQEGIMSAEYLYGTNFGISKKFFDSKLRVNLGVEDFINRFWHAKVDYQQDLELVSRWQAPIVSAKVSYKFGNQHLKSKKRTSSSGSEEIRRATQ